MNQQKSLLNPYATPYMPLLKMTSGINFEGENEISERTPADSGDTLDTASYLPPGTASKECDIQSAEEVCVSEASSSKVAYPTAISKVGTFQEETIITGEKNLMDDEDIIMDSLLSLFPGYSLESLAESFKVNHGDLGETIYMLEQLEFEDVGSEEITETSGTERSGSEK